MQKRYLFRLVKVESSRKSRHLTITIQVKESKHAAIEIDVVSQRGLRSRNAKNNAAVNELGETRILQEIIEGLKENAAVAEKACDIEIIASKSLELLLSYHAIRQIK